MPHDSTRHKYSVPESRTEFFPCTFKIRIRQLVSIQDVNLKSLYENPLHPTEVSHYLMSLTVKLTSAGLRE